jgi:transcriptional regulator with XRE-family HTH domain
MTNPKHHYNQCLIQAIRALRKTRNIKQMTMADALSMSECNYSKIETHYKALNTVQLLTVTEQLGISLRRLVGLTDVLYSAQVNEQKLHTVFFTLKQEGVSNIFDDFKDEELIIFLQNLIIAIQPA